MCTHVDRQYNIRSNIPYFTVDSASTSMHGSLKHQGFYQHVTLFVNSVFLSFGPELV